MFVVRAKTKMIGQKVYDWENSNNYLSIPEVHPSMDRLVVETS